MFALAAVAINLIFPELISSVNVAKDEFVNKRSQDLERYYRLNGAIYICKTDNLLKEKTFFLKNNIYSYKMDRESSVDIDEKIDFQLANLIIEKVIV